MRTFNLFAAATTCTFLAALPSIVLAEVQFTAVATSNHNSGLGLSVPSINNQGIVAFADDTSIPGSLRTGNGGPLTTIVTNQYYFNSNGIGSGAPGINDSGVVAFWGRTDAFDDHAVLSGTQGGLVTIATGAGPTDWDNLLSGSPQIDNAGTVVYRANFPTNNPFVTGSGVFTGTGGAPTTIASSSTSTAGTAIDPAISHNGTIAYEWHVGSLAVGVTDSLYTVKNGVTTFIANAPDFYSHLAVNDAGVVVASTLSSVLQMGNAATIATVPNPSPFISTYNAVAINDNNILALDALYSTPRSSAIYAGPASNLTALIATGDAFDGSVVTSLATGEQAINDRGQVTFWALFADGHEGIYVASVPEPSSVVMSISAIGIGLIAYLMRRRR